MSVVDGDFLNASIVNITLVSNAVSLELTIWKHIDESSSLPDTGNYNIFYSLDISA